MNHFFLKIFRFSISKLVFFVFLFISYRINSYAEIKKESTPKTPKLLDFETDIIEGERAVPNIFIEMDIHKAGLDLILYQRNNFNDFHLAEKNRRPRYFNIKNQNQNQKGK